MRGVGADQSRLPGRRAGQQAAADVARRQSARAQAGEHQVGEVLADPRRRSSTSSSGVATWVACASKANSRKIFSISAAAATSNGRPGGKQSAANSANRRWMRTGRLDAIAAGFQLGGGQRPPGKCQPGGDGFPCRRRGRLRRRMGEHFDLQSRADPQRLVGTLEGQPAQRIARMRRGHPRAGSAPARSAVPAR